MQPDDQLLETTRQIIDGEALRIAEADHEEAGGLKALSMMVILVSLLLLGIAVSVFAHSQQLMSTSQMVVTIVGIWLFTPLLLVGGMFAASTITEKA
jgi:hypothetical protein